MQVENNIYICFLLSVLIASRLNVPSTLFGSNARELTATNHRVNLYSYCHQSYLASHSVNCSSWSSFPQAVTPSAGTYAAVRWRLFTAPWIFSLTGVSSNPVSALWFWWVWQSCRKSGSTVIGDVPPQWITEESANLNFVNMILWCLSLESAVFTQSHRDH